MFVFDMSRLIPADDDGGEGRGAQWGRFSIVWADTCAMLTTVIQFSHFGKERVTSMLQKLRDLKRDEYYVKVVLTGCKTGVAVL